MTGAHLLPVDQLSRLDVGPNPGGLILGHAASGEQVAVRIFREQPTQLVLLGSGYLARLLAFRSLGVGATVEVTPPTWPGWEPLLDLQPRGLTRVVAPGSPPVSDAGPDQPSLRLEQVAPEAVRPSPGLTAWQARAVVPQTLSAPALTWLSSFDLVLARRVPPAAVPGLQQAFGLSDGFAQELPRLPLDVVALLAGAGSWLLNLALTPVELAVLGPPTN